jgi:hypothetical protein
MWNVGGGGGGGDRLALCSAERMIQLTNPCVLRFVINLAGLITIAHPTTTITIIKVYCCQLLSCKELNEPHFLYFHCYLYRLAHFLASCLQLHLHLLALRHSERVQIIRIA